MACVNLNIEIKARGFYGARFKKTKKKAKSWNKLAKFNELKSRK